MVKERERAKKKRRGKETKREGREIESQMF